MKSTVFAVLAAAAVALPAAAAPAVRPAAPVQVVVVGTFHFSNPGQDMANIRVPDVSAPERQVEIQRIVAGLNRFHPTVVATEWPADLVNERWARFMNGSLGPSSNEVVQLGFRLGKLSGARVVGADQDGDFPFDPILAFAASHGHPNYLEEVMEPVLAEVNAASERLARGTLGAELHHINTPAEIARTNGFYNSVLRMGEGDIQPGADLNGAWAKRNFRICARIIQESKPGDRIVVLFGAGHAYWLKRCLGETPGFEVVEANRYLPRR
ncbi:MAG: hypothetical protein K1X35_02775 [Caulobacteraceae bacterium]|nr:hypothetical protein [Caulobacteraceae bacterium]